MLKQKIRAISFIGASLLIISFESFLGAEMTPLVAYLLGFAAIQILVSAITQCQASPDRILF